MQQVIRLNKIVDIETTKGVVARTTYTESEMDDLARRLALQHNKEIANSYWDSADIKEYVTRDLPPAPEPVVEAAAEATTEMKPIEELNLADAAKVVKVDAVDPVPESKPKRKR